MRRDHPRRYRMSEDGLAALDYLKSVTGKSHAQLIEEHAIAAAAAHRQDEGTAAKLERIEERLARLEQECTQ